MIRWKNETDRKKFDDLDHRVRFLVELFEFECTARDGDVVVTDIDTAVVHMAGSPHYDKRAVDLRIAPLTLAEAERWARKINGTFRRGDGKLVVLVGVLDPARNHDDHIHIQVPRPYQRSGGIRL